MTNTIKNNATKNLKFRIDGIEYMRVESVWFRWDRYQVKYIPEDRPELERLYMGNMIQGVL